MLYVFGGFLRLIGEIIILFETFERLFWIFSRHSNQIIVLCDDNHTLLLVKYTSLHLEITK